MTEIAIQLNYNNALFQVFATQLVTVKKKTIVTLRKAARLVHFGMDSTLILCLLHSAKI